MLREYDWDMFKADRRYREREIMPDLAESKLLSERMKVIPDMLDCIIIDEWLDMIMDAKVDKRTLEIVYMRRDGYTTEEIAAKLKLTPKAIYRREERLRKKIKKLSNLRGK